MSNRYKGGVLSATPPTTSSSAAPGIWTLEQQMQATAGTGWPFGGPFTYIEDVFSTYLYTGTGSSQTITNGIDLSTKGGLVWIKDRTTAGVPHRWFDTVRGGTKSIRSNSTSAENTGDPAITFNTTGFTTSTDVNGEISASGDNFVSWTFREQAKFFDIVTYTGDGNQKVIAHNLGSAPGFIIAKATSTTGDWAVWHRSTTFKQGYLNTTADFTSAVSNFTTNAGTSTTFTVNGPPSGGILSDVGVTYVAYLFAHDAGGFGLTGNDNVISCGSFTTDGSGNATVSLGYEPQWLITKTTGISDDWYMADIMRGWTADGAYNYLLANTSGAESSVSGSYRPTATGFVVANGGASRAYIYIAIRRGPMKVPTVGTSVFTPVARAGTSAVASVNTGIVTDAVWETGRSGQTNFAYDRLRGPNTEMSFTSTNGESTYTATATLTGFDSMTGFTVGADASSYINGSGINYINWIFQRAPSFFDEVCYTGTGTAGLAVTHNLGVVPELIIVKGRSYVTDWAAYSATLGNTQYLIPNTTAAAATSSLWWNNTSPTSTTFTLGNGSRVNNTSSDTYVAYLFATCAGVSKVGSYTGTATTKQIDCGFTAGARFVLIKRTDSTGDWYVYDSARGIVSGNDPYLLLNSTAAEVTGTDYVDTYNAGFELSSTAPAGLNANGGTYIFLAIA